jgi:16S rRNA (cytidine1402-2'-O)-methyltransferase
VRRGTLGTLAAYYTASPPRGEVVLLVGGRDPAAAPAGDVLRARAAELLAAGGSARDVARRLVDELGASRNAAYEAAQGARGAAHGADDRDGVGTSPAAAEPEAE